MPRSKLPAFCLSGGKGNRSASKASIRLSGLGAFLSCVLILDLFCRPCFFSFRSMLPCPAQQIKLLGEMVEGEGETNQMEVGAVIDLSRQWVVKLSKSDDVASISPIDSTFTCRLEFLIIYTITNCRGFCTSPCTFPSAACDTFPLNTMLFGCVESLFSNLIRS